MEEQNQPLPPVPIPQGVVGSRVSQVRYEDPSVVKFLVQNRDLIESFTKLLCGYVEVPISKSGEMGELAWYDTQKPLINKEGVLWLVGKLTAASDKMIYLSNYPEPRLKSILNVEFDDVAVHLATHINEYGIKPEDCEFIMSLFRNVLEASYRRPVGDKERGHIYGSVEESVDRSPRNDNKLFGFFPRP